MDVLSCGEGPWCPACVEAYRAGVVSLGPMLLTNRREMTWRAEFIVALVDELSGRREVQ